MASHKANLLVLLLAIVAVMWAAQSVPQPALSGVVSTFPANPQLTDVCIELTDRICSHHIAGDSPAAPLTEVPRGACM